MANISSRLVQLREQLSIKKFDGFLVSNSSNRYYLSGWLGDSESGYLLITPKKEFVLTDSRYTEEAVLKTANFEIREFGGEESFWSDLFHGEKLVRVGVEASDLTVARYKKLKKLTATRLYPTVNLVENLRSNKDKLEIKTIQKAISIADESFRYLLENIRIGQTEKEIAWEMEKFMKASGASKNAWEPFIVASGPNSSMVHYAAGDRKIRKGDQILLDWGCFFQGYCCDISRVIFLGSPTEKQAEIYNLVLEAQRRAVKLAKTGKSTSRVETTARDFLKTQTNYFFNHAVGHGVGLDVHELPKINEKAKDKFSIGNVITVEPGIYIPGWGGVRIEDMYLLTATGNVQLTKSPKKLTEVIIT